MATSTLDAPAPQTSQASAPKSELAAIRDWLQWLTVAMFLVALAFLFLMSAVFGAIVEWHAGEGILIAGASGGGATFGFLLGWLARRATH